MNKYPSYTMLNMIRKIEKEKKIGNTKKKLKEKLKELNLLYRYWLV